MNINYHYLNDEDEDNLFFKSKKIKNYKKNNKNEFNCLKHNKKIKPRRLFKEKLSDFDDEE